MDHLTAAVMMDIHWPMMEERAWILMSAQPTEIDVNKYV
jgi:hypothetical protein